MLFSPLDLERALATSITTWTADILLKNPADRGEVPIPPSVYVGYIPSFQAGPSLPLQHKAPSIAILNSTGQFHREYGEATVNIFILTWDDNLDHSGYQDGSNIIYRITNGLYETVVIGKAFMIMDDPVHYNFINDPSVVIHPYYCAMMEVKFGLCTPGPNRAPYGLQTGPNTFTVTGPNQ